MRKLFFCLFVILNIFLITSCSTQKVIIQGQPLPEGKKIFYFYYSLINNDEVLKAYPVGMSEQANSVDAINIMLQRLSEEFSKGNDIYPASEIKFELMGISYVETNIRKYPVAVINISDPRNIMESRYFQGSTGGMVTQNTILLNVLQPQIQGFVDGCLIYINNIPVGEMDHVNFQGIISATRVEYLAEQVTRR